MTSAGGLNPISVRRQCSSFVDKVSTASREHQRLGFCSVGYLVLCHVTVRMLDIFLKKCVGRFTEKKDVRDFAIVQFRKEIVF